MSALMNECAHGSDGSYRDASVPGCPYCEIDRLRAALEGFARNSYNPDFSLRLMRKSIEKLLRGEK